jgi:hypothetical protein
MKLSGGALGVSGETVAKIKSVFVTEFRIADFRKNA